MAEVMITAVKPFKVKVWFKWDRNVGSQQSTTPLQHYTTCENWKTQLLYNGITKVQTTLHVWCYNGFISYNPFLSELTISFSLFNGELHEAKFIAVDCLVSE